jgi:class 3 adenylate cyclase
MGHKGIEVKITSDYGQHTIVRYGSDHARSHVNIISVTMNLAAKMHSVTIGSQMVVGRKLYDKLLDNLSRKRLEKAAVLDNTRWN